MSEDRFDEEVWEDDSDSYPPPRWQRIVVLLMVALLAAPLVIGAVAVVARALF